MTKTALIADIGGTNARFGIVDQNGTHDLVYMPCQDYTGPAEAAEAYFQKIGIKNKPSIGVIAVAGPVEGDLINFTNISWAFRCSALQQDLQLSALEVMNDFKAVALAVPGISPKLVTKIGGGEIVTNRAIGVIGPGTGLGVASLIWSGSEYVAQPGEGGHVTIAPVNDREYAIFQQLHVKYHHISAERVCSGKGLENLYNAIRVLDNKLDRPDRTAPEISEHAIKGTCEICKETLDLMLGFLGRVSGNLALTIYAQSGVYIAGGIPTKLGDYFSKSRFMEEFQAKGRQRGLMEKIPVFMINHDAIGLLGLEQRAQHLLKTSVQP
jgi:glucokinase